MKTDPIWQCASTAAATVFTFIVGGGILAAVVQDERVLRAPVFLAVLALGGGAGALLGLYPSWDVRDSAMTPGLLLCAAFALLLECVFARRWKALLSCIDHRVASTAWLGSIVLVAVWMVREAVSVGQDDRARRHVELSARAMAAVLLVFPLGVHRLVGLTLVLVR